jgi:3D (Asp-Asp-Asp) domain-containing protein
MFAGLLALNAIALAGGHRQQKDNVETRVETKTLPSTVRYEFSRTVGAGRLVKAQEGKSGYIKRTFKVTVQNGKVVDRDLVKEERSEAVPTVFLMGKAGYNPGRSGFERGKVLTMSATAYDPGPKSNGGWAGRTRTGMKADFGIVAVDPRVIPLGTLVYVEGYGFAIAADTGGAIKGNRIDLCYNDRSFVANYGRRDVKVHILKSR